MPLQYKVADLADVDERLRQHYKQVEDGSFLAEIEGYESEAELREGLRAEKAARLAAKAEIRRLQQLIAERHAPPREPERLADDDAEYERQYGPKRAAFAEAQQAEVASLRADRDRVAIDSAVEAMASDLALDGCAEVLECHIRDRLEVVETDAGYHVAVKGSAATLDEMRDKIRSDPRFARALKGTSPIERARHARRVAETLAAPSTPARLDKPIAHAEVLPAAQAYDTSSRRKEPA